MNQDMMSALDAARAFAGDILYAPAPHLDALVLAIAASHALKSFDTVPRLLFTSPAGQSGKSTALDVIRLLGSNPWSSTGATSFALRAKFNEPETPFVLADEISDIFGRSGLRGSGNQIGLIARDGYRRTATLSLASDRMADDVSSFCFLAMAGLKTAVPADIRTRCIVFPMNGKPMSARMPRESTDPDTETEAAEYAKSLHFYVRALGGRITAAKRSFVSPHPLFADRRQQIWISLLLTARAADEYDAERRAELGLTPSEEPSWETRCMTAFRALALDASDLPALLPVQKMLRDVAGIFRDSGAGQMFVADILDALRVLPEPIWENLTDRRIAHLMTDALGTSQVMTMNNRRARGFHAKPAIRAWEELERTLLPPAAVREEDETALFFADIPRTERTVQTVQEKKAA